MSNKSSFIFKEIYLLESSFRRNHIVDFKNPKFKNRVNISVEHQVLEENHLHITVALDFSAGRSREKEISSKIKMTGIFIKGEESVLTVEQFAKANGPAIMFPFLREHLASITTKAGISPVLLPAVNFIKLAEEDKIKRKSIPQS